MKHSLDRRALKGLCEQGKRNGHSLTTLSCPQAGASHPKRAILSPVGRRGPQAGIQLLPHWASLPRGPRQVLLLEDQRDRNLWSLNIRDQIEMGKKVGHTTSRTLTLAD